MELLPECSAKRNLQMLAKIKNIADEKDIIFSLERVGLDPDSDKKVKKFSYHFHDKTGKIIAYKTHGPIRRIKIWTQ